MKYFKELKKKHLEDKELLKRFLEIENTFYVSNSADEISRSDLMVYDEYDIKRMFKECEYILGCFEDGKLIGYLALEKGNFKFAKEQGETYVYNFMVDPEYSQDGLGTRMFQRAFRDHISKMEDRNLVTLEVEYGLPAEELYKKLGFKEVNYKPNKLIEYDDGCPQKIMCVTKEELGKNLEERTKRILKRKILEKKSEEYSK